MASAAALRSGLVSSAMRRNSSSGWTWPLESNGAGHIEWVHRCPVVQQCQELDLRGPQIYGCRLPVGFVLDTLQLQAVQIHLRNVAGLPTIPIHSQKPVIVSKIILRELQDRFGLQRLNKGVSQAENQSSFLIHQVRRRDTGCLAGAVPPQFALMLTFVVVASRQERKRVRKRAVRIRRKRVKLVERHRDIRVGLQKRGGLIRPSLFNSNSDCLQSRIGGFKPLSNLLPAQSSLTKSDFA